MSDSAERRAGELARAELTPPGPDRRRPLERRQAEMRRSLEALGLPDRRQRQRRQPPDPGAGMGGEL